MSENESGPRAIISRNTLLPLSLVLIVGGGMFGLGVSWSSQGHRITDNEKAIGSHETRLQLAEARLELWRRLVEVRLSMELPEPKGVSLDPGPPPPSKSPIIALGGLGSPGHHSEPGG